jgi:hypothetical protein
MTSHVARLYAVAGALVALFLAWAGIAARPWPEPRAAAATPASLTAYEQRLDADAKLVAELVARRQPQTAAAAPVVRVVTLPPLTTTRTS